MKNMIIVCIFTVLILYIFPDCSFAIDLNSSGASSSAQSSASADNNFIAGQSSSGSYISDIQFNYSVHFPNTPTDVAGNPLGTASNPNTVQYNVDADGNPLGSAANPQTTQTNVDENGNPLGSAENPYTSTTKVKTDGAYRQFANVPETQLPSLSSYFGEQSKGAPLLQSVRSIMEYRPLWFTYAELQELVGDKEPQVLSNAPETNPDPGGIKVLLNGELAAIKAENRAMKLDNIMSLATNRQQDSATCLYAALLKAMQKGANAVVIQSEGIQMELFNRSKGLGANGGGGSLFGPDKIFSALIGISPSMAHGQAGNWGLPFVRLHALKVQDLGTAQESSAYQKYAHMRAQILKQPSRQAKMAQSSRPEHTLHTLIAQREQKLGGM